MTRGLSQRAETKESFVRGEARFVLGSESRTANKHSKVIRKRGSFTRVEQVFDGNCSLDACEASIGPLEVQGWRPVVRLVLYDRPGSAFAGAKILRVGIGTKIAATCDCGRRSG